MAPFVIHTVPGSPFARSVAAALEEKGAEWRLAPLAPGQHKAPEHLARHPFGRMPAVEHGNVLLYETQAILRYLDRVLPDPALTPSDPVTAARMDQVMSINDWYLFHGCANVIAFQRVVGPTLLGLTPDEAAITEAMPRAHVAFAELSRLLGRHDWFAGAQLTLADLHVAPQLDFLAMTPEWQALTAGRENLVEWLARMNERPSMQRTTPAAIAA